MTKREIVKAAINHEETGVIPYCINFTREGRENFKKYYPDGEMQLAIGNFVYKIGCPWWTWHDVPKSYRDYAFPNEMPKTRGTGNYQAFEEKIKEIKESTGSYILVTIYGSHFEKANFARGIENFLADIGGAKDFAQELLNTIIRKNIVMLENILSFPEVDGILLGSDWGSQQSILMSPTTWRELIAPGELKEYKLIKEAGKDVWIHSCGNITQIIPDLVEMGIDVLNPVQPEAMDIYKLKEDFGDKITFWGGISTQQTLPYGTVEEVKAETAEVISKLSKGGGYISSPAQEIQGDVPVENVLALLETCKSYAKLK